MSLCRGPGRFGNKIIRSIATSIFCSKHDLYIHYEYKEEIEKIGIKLYVGKKKYNETNELNDNNYFVLINKDTLHYNVVTNGYFQTKNISDKIHKYLNTEKISKEIMTKNNYKNRYNNNNDCFIHIRLGDVSKYNPGFEYYDNILSKINYDKLYISSDTLHHTIIKNISSKYKNVILYENDLTDIMLFASTCKYVVLSYGTFSAIIGYLSYYSQVYCLPFIEKYAWDWNAKDECDMFRNKRTFLNEWIISC